MKRSTPGLPVHHQLPEFTQTHVYRVGDAIQPSHPLSSPFPHAPSPSRHHSLFQWVNLHMRWPKHWSFSLSISSSNENPGLGRVPNILPEINNFIFLDPLEVSTIYNFIIFFRESNWGKDSPGGASGKEPTYQCRRHEPWIWSLGQEDPLEEGMEPTLAFLPRGLHGKRSLVGYHP